MYNPFFNFQTVYRGGSGRRCPGNCNIAGATAVPKENQKNDKKLDTKFNAKEICKEKEGQNHLSFKCSKLGGILIPDHTKKGMIYKIASINVDTSLHRKFLVKLNFSCGLSLEKAGVHIKFQILKQMLHQADFVPISPAFYFQRKKECSERDSFSFFSCDSECIRSSCCNYSVYAEVVTSSTEGAVTIESPILIAEMFENSNNV